MKPRRRPEHHIQRAVVQHLRCSGAPGAVNGGARRKTEAAILEGSGLRAGVADLCIVHVGRFKALELKAPGGRSTEEQLAFRNDVNAGGGYAAETVGLDAAIGCLEALGLLLRATQ
jgi:hypothetical protein